MKVKYIDTETTALEGRVLEYGELTVDGDGVVINEYNQLINPQEVIEIAAMSVHNITEEMVEDKPTFDEIASDIDYSDTDYVIAHNMKFDRMMLEKEGVDFSKTKVICTYEIVKQLMPKLFGNDKLGTLYYGFGCYHDMNYKGEAHRAIFDTHMLKLVTERLMSEYDLTFEEMHKMSKPKHISETECYTRKYKGLLWKEVKELDEGYCAWIVSNFDPDKNAELIEYLSDGVVC